MRSAIIDYWAARAERFRTEFRMSLSLYRQTRDRRWLDQARSELQRWLEADQIANEERDLERALFAA